MRNFDYLIIKIKATGNFLSAVEDDDFGFC